MNRLVKILSCLALALCVVSCGIYSFSGTSIQPDVSTITIEFFEYTATKVNPSLSNDLSEAIRTQFRKMTKLEQVDLDGDLTISGSISGYDISATSVTASEEAAKNRLTITVRVSFRNRLHPEDDFSDKSFSQYEEFDATESFDSVESTLCTQIVDKLVEDIFNATVAQW